MEPTRPAVLAGRWRLQEVVGRGGMATVFRARDERSGEVVAVKVLRREHADPRRVARFALEAVIMRFLDHPNVPAVLEMGHDDAAGFHYVVMAYAERGSASEVLRAEGPLPADVVAGWMVCVLCALEAAHERGIVHRDVKPANVLVRADGTALLTDFGIVRTPAGDLPVDAGGALGTPSFMAPEQRRCPDDVGPECDLYAVGATLYVLVTGRTAYGLSEAERGDARWHLLPEGLQDIVFRAMRRDEADRWHHARAMATALAPFVPARVWIAAPHLARWLEPAPAHDGTAPACADEGGEGGALDRDRRRRIVPDLPERREP